MPQFSPGRASPFKYGLWTQKKKQLDNVNCSLLDTSGADYQLTSNPGSVIVPKGKGPLQVKCNETGYKNYSGAINSTFNPVTLLDIFFWPTFFVDLGTGAAMKYPSYYDVVMTPEK